MGQVEYSPKMARLLAVGHINMKSILEVSKEYSEIKYPISTGSIEWQDIKSDLVVLDDSIIGLWSSLDAKKLSGNEIEKRTSFIKNESQKIIERVSEYQPISIQENEEREILVNKLFLFRELLSAIVKDYNLF